MSTRRANALFYIFGAIKDLKPALLEDLRTRADAGQTDVAATWSADHSLDSPAVIEYVEELLQWWRDHPGDKDRLRARWGVALDACARRQGQAESDWIARMRSKDAYFALPDPSRQTLRQWLLTAEKLYRDREALIYEGGRRPRRPPVVRDHLPKHCEWFVRVRVLGTHSSEFPEVLRKDLTRPAIDAAVNAVTDLVGLRRPRQRGSQTA